MLKYVNAQNSVWYRAGALRISPVAITGASFSLPRSPAIQGHLTRDPVCTWRGQDLPSRDLKDMIGCEGLGWNLPFGGILQQRQDTFPCPGKSHSDTYQALIMGQALKFTSMSPTCPLSSP